MIRRLHVLVLLYVLCLQTEKWPRKPTRAPDPCSAPLVVASTEILGPTACARFVTKSTSRDRTAVSVLLALWVIRLICLSPALRCIWNVVLRVWGRSAPVAFRNVWFCVSGSSSVSSSPTAEASAIQIIEASLNNSVSEAEASSGATAALPVTQQMTEMSISCEEEVKAPKVEIPEPG